MAYVFDLKANIDSSAIAKANSTLGKYIQNATGAAQKTDKFGSAQKQLNKATDALKSSLSKMNSVLGKFPMITGGITLGLGSLISQSWDAMREIMNMRAELKHLSDTSGNVSAAWGVMMNSWSGSIASLATIKGSMNALNNAGVRVGATMQNLTTFISNMHQASGLSIEKLGQLTGELTSYWSVSTKGAREVVSSIVAAQSAFRSTTAEMEQFMSTVIEAQSKVGMLAKDGEASSKALASGITMAAGAMRSFGISAQKATSFLDKLLDPERFDETSGLLRRLGITVEEQFRAMETAGGKEMFFDKILEGLPKLSQELMTISNPIARFRYAKGLGLDPEIAAKMASANQGQMGKLVAEYKAKIGDEKAAKEKQRLAQADAARFDDQIKFLKFKILGPMIQFVQEAFGRISKAIPNISGFLKNIVGFIADGFVKLLRASQPIIDVISGKGNQKLSDVAGPVIGNMVKILFDKIKAAVPTIMIILKEVMKGAIKVFIEMFKEHPLLMSAIFGGKALGMLSNVGGFMKGFTGKAPLEMLGGLMKGGGAAAGSSRFAGLLSKIPGGLGGLGTKGLGALGSVAKVAGPIGLAISAALGGWQGAKAMGPEATFGQKAGGATAGALTLGIAPLIDSIFGTKITPTLGKHMKNILLVNPLTAPAGLMLRAMEAFSSKSLTVQEQQDKKMLDQKMMLGQKLTKEEQKRADELSAIMKKNHTTWAQGFANLWADIKSLPFTMWDSIKSGWNKLTGLLGRIYEWWQEKISMPITANITEISALISAKLSFDSEQTAKFEAQQKAWEEFNRLRAIGIGARESIYKISKGGGVAAGLPADMAYQLREAAKIQLRMLDKQTADAREADALRRKQLEEQRKANQHLGGAGGKLNEIADNTKPKTTTESSFLKDFMGNYGFTSLSGSIS